MRHIYSRRLTAMALFTLAGLAAPQLSQACATCGCTLNSDAAAGFLPRSGWSFNLEYTYINQNELRHGSGTASAADVVNNPTTGELEQFTKNHYLNLGITYGFNPDWNLSLIVPYVRRDHGSFTDQTSAPFDPSQTDPAHLSESHSSSIGDMKVLLRYQGFLPNHNAGVVAGIKLPTGSDSATNFSSGPSAGQPLDTSLQAGTGSTDLILGAFYYQALSQNWDGFANFTTQFAVAERLKQPGNNFRPGNLSNLSLGLRYITHSIWTPQLQLNLTHKSADQGALADDQDTAGTVAYLSPGVNIQFNPQLSVYAFVQKPIASQLQGYQIFPRWTATLGMYYAL
ncbi:MAG: transporter family protein [Halothiobacillus sp.]